LSSKITAGGDVFGVQNFLVPDEGGSIEPDLATQPLGAF